VLEGLRSLVLGQDRPSMAAIEHRVSEVAARYGRRPPSRASLYNALSGLEGHTYRVERLPPKVREALYNLAPEGAVPGHQVVFYCFNYGSLAAVSYAAGLPWIDLYQARRVRGWRSRSLGLLHAAMRVRGIA
jgi:hypothetical protein